MDGFLCSFGMHAYGHGAVIARHADGMWIISLYDNVADEG